MSVLSPYLFFTGNCREAVNFYKSCFNGELSIMTYGDGTNGNCPADQKDKIMHAFLECGKLTLMASDSFEGKVVIGDNVQIGVMCESLVEIETLFKSLSAKGKIDDPLQDASWGAKFGTLTDRYGVKWLLNYEDRSKK